MQVCWGLNGTRQLCICSFAACLHCVMQVLLIRLCSCCWSINTAAAAAAHVDSQAIDFWLGSVIMHIWEAVNKQGASNFGMIVGSGLLVGDGLWAIPSSIVAIFGKAPPICMGFYGAAGGCKLPYCIGFWLGGSDMTPGGAVTPMAG